MSEILGVSFDILSSPSLKVHNSKENLPKNNSGWGIAWYPNDDYAASVVKDITNNTAKNFSRLLSSWDNFCSTVFLFKLAGQSQAYTQHNTQPFSKSYGGRDWIFCHRGNINKEEFEKTLTIHEGFFEPLGTTDSELIFCHLLSKFHDHKSKAINEINQELIHLWLKTINSFGTSDIVLSDGQTILLYRDQNASDALFYRRQVPPHNGELFESDLCKLQLDINSEPNRAGMVFSSSKPLDMTNWQTLYPGQLILIRRGDIVWSSYIEEKLEQNRQHETQTQMNAQLAEPSTKVEAKENENKNTMLLTLNVKATTKSLDGDLLQYKTYSVLHETKYEYEKEIDRSTHILRIQPIDDQVQELVQTTLEISKSCENALFEDVFGNPAIFININKPYKELLVRSKSTVKIYQVPPDDFSMSIRRASIPLVWMPWQRQMMSPYLLPPELPETQLQELSDYAMSFVERNDYNLFETLKDINARLHKDFKYQSGSTTLETTPYDVFVSRKGVCQDFANLFICLSRLLSIPARYRVGYIYTGGSYENKEQGDATHAWAEAYLPYIGWRGFDPTNGCLVSQDHIRVACGRHFRDATPTSGTIFSNGVGEKLSVNVKVTELSQ